MFIDSELQNAIEKVQKTKKIILDKYLTRMLIGKINELKKEMSFAEAIRRALNQINIWDKETRTMYASLAGTYFGRRGGRKSAQTKKRKQGSKTNEVKLYANRTLINKKGQHEFDF